MRLLVLALLATLLIACWDRTPSQTPEECKLTTDPEACRKAFRR